MQKSTKRLLSMLMVLALVLTLAPAGILAVETKAEGTEPEIVYGSANLPAGVQDKIDEATAIQAAAKTALANGTCPVCNKAVTWEALPGGDVGTYITEMNTHYVISGEYTNTKNNFILFNNAPKDATVCLLLDNANATLSGRILGYTANGTATLNIMGTGTMTDTASVSGYGLLSSTSAITTNLYGGTFVSTAATAIAKATVYMSNPNAVMNIWTDEVVIGKATQGTTMNVNTNIVSGTVNMYAGTFQNGYTTTQNQGGNVFIQGAGTFNMYGGTIKGGNGGNGAIGTNVHCRGTFNMYGGEIKDGKANSYQAGGQISVSTGTVATAAPAVTPTFNMYGGKISNGEQTNGSFGRGGNINIAGSHANLDASVGYGKMTISGTALIEGGKAVKGNGGNIIVAKGGELEMTGGKIAKGQAVKGGGIFIAAGTTVKLGGLITGGYASQQGGNVFVDSGASVTLGDVTITNGTAVTASLGSNVRISSGTLKLSGNAVVPSGILMTASDNLVVEPTFSGDVYIWHTGGVTLGGAVANSSATGAFTGVVKNGSWLYTAAANGQSDVYIPVAMEWDGATGLKYAACGVVYNGAITPAANSQAAVDAYVAAMADEEVEEKPQYVYVTEDVELKNGAEVAIWAANDITVSGNGVVLGVDRKNDNYAEHGAAITVAGDVTVAADVTAGGRHYVALSDAATAPNTYTFHRVESKLTNVTVNVDNAGLYYKAQYKFDDVVKARIVSYGVLVNLDEEATVESYKAKTTATNTEAYADAALTASSHGVYGVFKDANDPAKNLAQGQMELNGNPYLVINTTNETKDQYPMFAAKNIAMSMSGAMELANENWEALTEEAQGYLNAFVNKWNAKGAWAPELLEALTNFEIA